jgi:hypothetical protein
LIGRHEPLDELASSPVPAFPRTNFPLYCRANFPCQPHRHAHSSAHGLARAIDLNLVFTRLRPLTRFALTRLKGPATRHGPRRIALMRSAALPRLSPTGTAPSPVAQFTPTPHPRAEQNSSRRREQRDIHSRARGSREIYTALKRRCRRSRS